MKDILYTEKETQLMCQNFLFAYLNFQREPNKKGWSGVRWWNNNRKKTQDSIVTDKIEEELNKFNTKKL